LKTYILIFAILMVGVLFLSGCSVFEQKIGSYRDDQIYCRTSDAHPWACDGFLTLEE
jgi:hypothetical protein